MKKLRVLQVGKYYAPFKGGMESSLELLCRGLKDHVDLEVLVANESNKTVREEWNGVSVHRLAQQLKVSSSSICLGLWQAMRVARADIVHIHLPNPLALLTFHLGGISSRLICTYHSDIVKQRILAQIIEPLQEGALKRCEALIAGTPQLIESSPVLSRHKDRCVVIPFGLRDSCFHPADAGDVAALRLKFPGPIILGVGRLVYYKGFEVLIQAFARVRRPGTLLIVGEGPLRQKLEQLITELGLEGRVVLMGSVPETAPYFEACDVFVLSSVAKTETFGVVQLEAMARSKPVINTNLESGVTFVSIHEQTGLTVPIGNVEALGEAINRLLQDPSLRKRYGEAGYQRVITEFTAEKMVKRTLELYETTAI